MGIKELKNNTSQILKEVRVNKREFIITLNNDEVALLVPLTQKKKTEIKTSMNKKWLTEALKVAKEVGEL